MNTAVQDIIRPLFLGVDMTEEALALKEELTADLEERYADLLASGVTEDEAIARLQEAVEGFDAVTADLPHAAAPALTSANTAAPQPAPETSPVPSAVVPEKTDARMRAIRIELSAEDLHVGMSPDDQMHLAVDGDHQPEWQKTVSGDTVTLTIRHNAGPEQDEFANIDPAKLDRLGRLLLKVHTACRQIGSHITVFNECHGTVLIPLTWLPELSIRTASGDVTVDAPVSALNVQTVSGDAHLTLSASCASVSAQSVSGDLQVDGSAAAQHVHLKTVSGDAQFTGGGSSITYSAVSGDITLSVTGPVSSISGSTVSGDTNIHMCSGQPVHVQANTRSGDVSVSAHDGPQAAPLSLSSVSGDITVR